ncbi:MAG: SUF system NifU family Fe-S cluster assembly protein [Steroidobacteraceae bacterium]
MDLKELYRDVILDHNRSPRHFGRLEPADATARGNNPLCGDELTVTLRTDGDRIADLRFEGRGCAISVASASLMSEAVKGMTRKQFADLYARVHEVLTHHDAEVPEELGKVAALAGVRDFPARVKCATLSWHTLAAALRDAREPVSTE